jgi:hypothetical protein
MFNLAQEGGLFPTLDPHMKLIYCEMKNENIISMLNEYFFRNS